MAVVGYGNTSVILTRHCEVYLIRWILVRHVHTDRFLLSGFIIMAEEIQHLHVTYNDIHNLIRNAIPDIREFNPDLLIAIGLSLALNHYQTTDPDRLFRWGVSDYYLFALIYVQYILFKRVFPRPRYGKLVMSVISYQQLDTRQLYSEHSFARRLTTRRYKFRQLACPYMNQWTD